MADHDDEPTTIFAVRDGQIVMTKTFQNYSVDGTAHASFSAGKGKVFVMLLIGRYGQGEGMVNPSEIESKLQEIARIRKRLNREDKLRKEKKRGES